jgi:hypothetical protein
MENGKSKLFGRQVWLVTLFGKRVGDYCFLFGEVIILRYPGIPDYV